MDLSDRVFLCQNPHCPYQHVAQDRDYNASHNILREALRLIGPADQAVSGTGSGTRTLTQACDLTSDVRREVV